MLVVRNQKILTRPEKGLFSNHVSCDFLLFQKYTFPPLLLPSGVTIKPGRPSLLIANGQSCAESTKPEATHNDCATIQVESSCLQIKSNATRGKIKSQRQETQTKRQKRGLQPPLLGKVARQKKLKVVKQTIVILIIARVQIAASSLVDFSSSEKNLLPRPCKAIWNIKIQQQGLLYPGDHQEYLSQ